LDFDTAVVGFNIQHGFHMGNGFGLNLNVDLAGPQIQCGQSGVWLEDREQHLAMAEDAA